MNYFSMGNQFFNLKLLPAEAMVFCAVSSIRNPFSYAICSADSVSKRTGLSIRTVYRALENLKDRRLLCQKKRYRFDGTRASNGYHVAPIGGGQFKIERDIFKYQLDASSFLVYLYLSKCINNTNCDAYPSLRKMANRLGLSKATVIAKIRKLHKHGVIAKLYQHHKRGYHCNQHLVCKLGFQLHITKKKGRKAMRPFLMYRPITAPITRCLNRTLSISRVMRSSSYLMKRKRRLVLLKVGWFKFGTTSLIPIYFTTKERIILDST